MGKCCLWTMGLREKPAVQVGLCQQRELLFELKRRDRGLQWRRGVRQLNILCPIFMVKGNELDSFALNLVPLPAFLFVSSWGAGLSNLCLCPSFYFGSTQFVWLYRLPARREFCLRMKHALSPIHTGFGWHSDDARDSRDDAGGRNGYC